MGLLAVAQILPLSQIAKFTIMNTASVQVTVPLLSIVKYIVKPPAKMQLSV